MKIWAADDEPLALEMLVESIEKVVPDSEIKSFLKPSELLEYAKKDSCDIVFLDINMYGISGVELAKELKKDMPQVNIIFATGYDEYTKDAMMMHASGYILKPVTVERVEEELKDLRYQMEEENDASLVIKCFGNFDVYTNERESLHFERSKAKETLAYLVYKSGTSCSVKEIAAAIFEDRVYDKKQQGYMQKIISSMMQALKSVGCENVIQKTYNSLAVDITAVDCDYYRFMQTDPKAVNTYSGEFMAQYAWAEFAVGYLDNIYWKQEVLADKKS